MVNEISSLEIITHVDMPCADGGKKSPVLTGG
jgi:hypothetical protein